MPIVNIFFATGFEEVEALTVVDLLRRSKIETRMISVTGELKVTGAHGITVEMDGLIEEISGDVDMIILPGGMPGTLNLKANDLLSLMITNQNKQNKYLAAICAAPMVFGGLGLLEGKNATSYPGFEKDLIGANVSDDKVVVDGNIITSRGVGTAIDFSLKIIELLQDKESANTIKEAILATD